MTAWTWRSVSPTPDSNNDLPLLTTVGHPVAVNPDSELRDRARDNGWPIYDFRRKRVTDPGVGIPAAATLASPPPPE